MLTGGWWPSSRAWPGRSQGIRGSDGSRGPFGAFRLTGFMRSLHQGRGTRFRSSRARSRSPCHRRRIRSSSPLSREYDRASGGRGRTGADRGRSANRRIADIVRGSGGPSTGRHISGICGSRRTWRVERLRSLSETSRVAPGAGEGRSISPGSPSISRNAMTRAQGPRGHLALGMPSVRIPRPW